MATEADVIIVGAGLSGLMAAHTLIKAGKEPLILEADQRVGGRILTEVIDGIPFELGAQWIGDTHYRMQALAEELAVPIYEQWEEGESSYQVLSEDVIREDEFYSRNAAAMKQVEQTLAAIDAMAQTVPADRPWDAPQALQWDRVTAGWWLDEQGLDPVARELLEICIVGILAVPTTEVSLLTMLYNIATCGVGAELYAESEGGAQTKRFAGGSSEIPNKLAEKVGRDRIVFGAFVQTIEHSPDSVTVTVRGGQQYRAKQVIVAIAPTLAGRITYDPPLSGKRDQMTQRIPQAHAVKVFAVYDEPFWRAEGLNGQLISSVGPARMSNDTCVPGNDAGIILAFLEGPQAREFGRLPKEELHAKVVEELTLHFGPKAAKPISVVSGEWSERPFTRGCYNANFNTHGWTDFGQTLAPPIGSIKWAATETANEWSAYMEGANEAGERAAKEVLESLD